jgi:hypothetical protein
LHCDGWSPLWDSWIRGQWLARFWLSWRIVHGADCWPPSKRNVFGIRHILVATGVVAAALALGRWSLQPTAASQETRPDEVLLPLVFGALGLAAATLATAVPAMAVVLRVRKSWLAVPMSLLISAGFCGGMAVVDRVIDGSQSFQYVVVALIPLCGGFCLALLGSLFLGRLLGYRLVWGRTCVVDPHTGRPN